MPRVMPSRGPLPGERHRAKLVRVAERVSRAGNRMLVWEWEIESSGEVFWADPWSTYSVLPPANPSQLRQHFEALGIPMEVSEIDTDELLGREVVLLFSRSADDEDQLWARPLPLDEGVEGECAK